MRLIRLLAGVCCFAIVTAVVATRASDCCEGHCSCVSCTGCGPCCEPTCKASWGESKTKKTVLSMKCEHACARGRDAWHAPQPECRCRPPCGKIYVKKRLFKSDGEEKVERVPTYEVEMVPAEPCDCAACRGDDRCWWSPFTLVSWLTGR
jgi:hypothetical protein